MRVVVIVSFSCGTACSTSPRVRGEVDLRAEHVRSEANRVRGHLDKLRLAATPPRPDSFAPLRCARNPTSPRTRGEVEQVGGVSSQATTFFTAATILSGVGLTRPRGWARRRPARPGAPRG